MPVAIFRCVFMGNTITNTHSITARFYTTIMRFILFAYFLNISLLSFSQQEIVSTTTAYITQNNFAQANHYLDSILKKNSKSVDALMMKGNLLLNYSWQNTSKSYFNIEKAESIFDTSSISQNSFIPIIPLDTSEIIEKLWQKCLLIDSTRTDIKKGLCNLYSISLRTGDLEKQLWLMKKMIAENPENAYVYSEYARNIKARGRFDDALKIYQVIADMFPNMAGPRCDMAGECFYSGKPNDALRYLDSAFSKTDIDETSYVNGAGIYSMLGYYDNAYKIFQRYSQQNNLLAADFYKGLMMFAQQDTGYYLQLKSFLQKATEQSYYDEVRLAQKLLPFSQIEFTLTDYKALITDATIPDYYKVLLHQRAMAQFKKMCEPYIQYGLFQCTINNFAIAAPFLEQIRDEDCETNNETEDFWKSEEYWALTYAYALYMSGDKEKALPTFIDVVLAKSSLEAFYKQAAVYFSAKIWLQQKENEKAKDMLREIRKGKTKYAWLAENYLSQLH